MKRRGISDPWAAYGRCFAESSALAKRQGYGLIEVTGMTYPGREHWACMAGDLFDGEPKVIDLTARQFTTGVPARYETDLDTWLDDACEWLGDGLRYRVFPSWPWQEHEFSGTWIRDDIDPEEFIREEAWRKWRMA